MRAGQYPYRSDLGLKPEGGAAERMAEEMRRDDTLYRRIAAEAKRRFE